MPITLKGSTSGDVTLTAPAVAGTNTITLPASTGTAIVSTTASPAQGDISYFNGTNWVSLAAGTSGRALVTGGAGANPSWAVPASMTLIGTATPSANVITFSGLSLSGYVYLYASISGTGNTGNKAGLSISDGTRTVTLAASPASNGSLVYGTLIADLTSTEMTAALSQVASGTFETTLGNNVGSGRTGISSSATTLTFAGLAGVALNTGSISLYGVK